MRGCTGKTDRVVRVLTVTAALAVGLTQGGSLGTGWTSVADTVGGIGLATGALGRCPVYALLGLHTWRG